MPITTKPSAAQSRILTALASRPAAKIINGPYGIFLTDGRGWSPADIKISPAQLVDLLRAGWLMQRKATSGRIEYVVTAAGREQAVKTQ